MRNLLWKAKNTSAYEGPGTECRSASRHDQADDREDWRAGRSPQDFHPPLTATAVGSAVYGAPASRQDQQASLYGVPSPFAAAAVADLNQYTSMARSSEPRAPRAHALPLPGEYRTHLDNAGYLGPQDAPADEAEFYAQRRPGAIRSRFSGLKPLVEFFRKPVAKWALTGTLCTVGGYMLVRGLTRSYAVGRVKKAIEIKQYFENILRERATANDLA